MAARGRATDYNATQQLNRDASPSRGSSRTLSVRVSAADVLADPLTERPLANPVLHIGLGKLSKTLELKEAVGQDRFSDQNSLQLPYNGEAFLRLMLSDGVYQCGWADIPVDQDALRVDRDEQVILKSRLDPSQQCGVINLSLKRSKIRVQSDVLIERTPLNASNTKPVHSVPSTAAPTPRGPLITAPHYKSAQVFVYNINALPDYCTRPYIAVRRGTAQPLEGSVREKGTPYNQVFALPLALDDRSVEISCLEDNPLARDRLVGSAIIPVSERDSYQLDDLELRNRVGACTARIKCRVDCSVIRLTAPPGVASIGHESRYGLDSNPRAAAAAAQASRAPPGAMANSLRVRIRQHFDNAHNAYMTVHLGQHEVRAKQFSDTQGDEIFFPYTGEPLMTFTAGQDRTMGVDPVLAKGTLNLARIARRPTGETVTYPVEMTHPETGETPGPVEVDITCENQREQAARVVPGPSCQLDSELPDRSAPKAIEIAVFKIVDAPASGSEYKIMAELGRDNARTSYPTSAVNGDLSIEQSYVCNNPKRRYAKLSLLDALTDECLGHVYLDLDAEVLTARRDAPNSIALSRSAGTMLYRVNPLDRKMQTARWVSAASAALLTSCRTLQVSVQAAYDLRYNSTTDILDPYCELLHGKLKIAGKQHKDAGLNPIFMETFTLPLEPGEALRLRVFDKAMLHKDTEIGTGAVDIDQLDGRQQLVVLINDGAPAGTVVCSVKGLGKETAKPSVSQAADLASFAQMHSTDLVKFDDRTPPPWRNGLTVTVHGARNLGGEQYAAKSGVDPTLTVHNGPAHVEAQALRIKDLSVAPIEQHFAFPPSEYRLLRFDVHDKKLLGKYLVGSGNLDLSDFARQVRAAEAAGATTAGPSAEALLDLTDSYGRPAGWLSVSVTQAATRVSSPIWLEKMTGQASKVAAVATCVTRASSCRIRLAEAHEIDLHVHPFIKVEWFGEFARSRTLTTADASGSRLWQDDFVLPCMVAQKSLTFTMTDDLKLARDELVGSATIADFEAILSTPEPTDRWVDFTKAGKVTGRVHMIFKPGLHRETALRCQRALDAVPHGTYNSLKLSVLRTSNLDFSHGRDVCDPYVTVTHDTYRLHGKVHNDAGVDAEILETFYLPARPGYPIELTLADHNTFSGDILIGTGLVALPDLTAEQPEGGERAELALYNHGHLAGRVDYIIEALPDHRAEPAFEILPAHKAPPRADAPPIAARAAPRALLGAAPPASPPATPPATDPVLLAGSPDGAAPPATPPATPPVLLAGAAPPGSPGGPGLYNALNIEVVKLVDVPLKDTPASPYVYLTIAGHKLRGHTLAPTASGSVSVGDVFYLPIEPAAEFIKFEIYDDQKLRRDPILASAKLSMSIISKSEKYLETQRLKLPLFRADGAPGGNLLMKVRGFADAGAEPASVTSPPPLVDASRDDVSSHGASRLADTHGYRSLRVELLNAADFRRAGAPYVICRLGEHSLRTLDAKHGEFSDVFLYPFTGERKLKLTVFDNRRLARDPELGYCKIDLEPLCVAGAEPHFLTAQLVDRRTGELARGEVTILLEFRRDAVDKAAALRHEPAAAVAARPEGNALALTDLQVVGLAPDSPAAPLRERLNPYLLARLGRAKLRSDRLDSADMRFLDSFEFDTSKAPADEPLELALMNNIRFSPDARLGLAKVDLGTLAGQEGVFGVALHDAKTGAPLAGAELVGAYFWSTKVMQKAARRVTAPPSPLEQPRLIVHTKIGGGGGGRAAAYTLTVAPTKIPACSASPVLELALDDGPALRRPLHPQGRQPESATLRAGGAGARVVHLTILDGEDPIMRGALDVSALAAGESVDAVVRCFGRGRYQELELNAAAAP